MSLPEQLQELDRRIAEAVERSVSEMRAEIGRRLRRRSDEVVDLVEQVSSPPPGSFLRESDLAPLAEQARSAGRSEALAALRDAVAGLDAAASQADILTALLEAASRFASRAALFLTRAEGVRGWASSGFANGTQAIDHVALDYDGLWRQLGERGGCVVLDASECARVSSQLAGESAADGVLIPLVLRDRLAAALYADRLERGALEVEALQVLTYAAAQALETLGLRDRAYTPTLVSSEPGAARRQQLALWESEGAAPVEPTSPLRRERRPVEAASPRPAPPPALTEGEEEDEAAAAPTRHFPAIADSFAAPAEAHGLAMEEVTTTEEIRTAVEEESPLDQTAGDLWTLEDAEPGDTAEEEYVAQVDSSSWEVPVAAAQPLPRRDESADRSPTLTSTAAIDAGEELGKAAQSVPPADEEEVVETVHIHRPLPSISPAPAPPAPPAPPSVPAAPSWRDARVAPPAAEPTPPPVAPLPPMTPPAAVAAAATTMRVTAPSPLPGTPPPPPPPAAPSTQVTPPAPKGESSEVKPPDDLQGPGWAFATTRVQTMSKEPTHEEARRLARLLVSEIKLYNEEQVEEGRRGRNIYTLLRDDIDRSRQMYEERIDPKVKGTTDYFQQELVRILAGGDAAALGI